MPEAIFDTPSPGDWVYRLTPVNAEGVEGEAPSAHATFPPAAPAKPTLELPLTHAPDAAEVTGRVAFSDEGGRFTGGHMVLPHDDTLNLGDGFTLDFEFRLHAAGEMPVLLCHGQWQAEGWFVQLLERRLTIRMPNGDATGPIIETDTWYRVHFVFDGVRVHLEVNGESIPQDGDIIRPVPSKRPLIIGQYAAPSDQYDFQGILKNIRIWNDALPK